MEITTPIERNNILGTAQYTQYTALEYFLGESGSSRSDVFSLAVLTYQMLSGRLPYGTKVAISRTKSAQKKLFYQSVLDDDRETPAWVDETLRNALHVEPYKRYEEFSKYIYDLCHPNKVFLNKTRAPLIERDPVFFWKSISVILTVIIVML